MQRGYDWTAIKENKLNEVIPELSDNSAELNAWQDGVWSCVFS
jgi:hypothetical protein